MRFCSKILQLPNGSGSILGGFRPVLGVLGEIDDEKKLILIDFAPLCKMKFVTPRQRVSGTVAPYDPRPNALLDRNTIQQCSTQGGCHGLRRRGELPPFLDRVLMFR